MIALDPVREARQMAAIRLWGKRHCEGTLEAATGFGKTIAALMGLRLLLTKYPIPFDPAWDAEIIVVVPTEHLKKKWEDDLLNWGLAPYSKVIIINTLVKYQLKCRCLVLDEIHAYTGPVFRQVFARVEYLQVLGLTATLPADDERRIDINRFCPVIDTVSMAECLNLGFISPYTIYNLGVNLAPDEMEAYAQATSVFQKGFSFFGHDLQYMFQVMNNNKTLLDFADHHEMTTGQARGMIKNALAGMRKRKEVIYRSRVKIDMAVAIINLLPEAQVITFSQETEVVDTLAERLGGEAVAYHASLPGRVIEGKKYSKKAIRELAIQRFRDQEVRVLCTAKALDQGADIPSIDLALVLSGTSTTLQAIQRYGRALRKVEGKTTKIVEIFARDTQDEKWLRSRQAKVPAHSIRWIDSVDEILE